MQQQLSESQDSVVNVNKDNIVICSFTLTFIYLTVATQGI